jgi:ABC-type antimicrobial peptide transport system permease subunit
VKPKTVVKIISEQSFVVLLSSFGLAIPIGVILTLLILIAEPAVTGYTILQIAGWLSISLLTLFVASLVPALRFAGKPILDVMSEF